MRGRESGSPELEKAAQYIAGQFKSDGLKTLDGKSYLQPFEITTSAKLGKANRFEYGIAGEKVAGAGADMQSLQPGKDFIAFNFSSRGKASGGVVFAGYGITAPEYNYDDYAGIDVQGKFVIVLAHEPQEYNEKSVFEGKIYTDHSQYYSKASNARKHGAAGVILITDRFNHRHRRMSRKRKVNSKPSAQPPVRPTPAYSTSRSKRAWSKPGSGARAKISWTSRGASTRM